MTAAMTGKNLARKVIGVITALFVVGVIANLREPFAALTFALLLNNFPDLFAEDATRFMRNLEYIGNTSFLVIAYFVARWVYRKVNPRLKKSETEDVSS